MKNLSFAPVFENGAAEWRSHLFVPKCANNGEVVYPTNVVLVTPELAQAWLDSSEKNRSESQYTIEKYARIMKRGEWRPNNCSTIGISKDGHLINGHHRLRAVVRAGIPVRMAVTFDADKGDFDIVDNGKKRSLADIFELEGISNCHNIASIVTRYVKLCNGRVLRLRGNGGVEGSPDLYQDYLDEYYSCDDYADGLNLFQKACRFADKLVRNPNSMRMLTISDVGAIYAFLVKKKEHKIAMVEDFFQLLYNGGNKVVFIQSLAAQLANDFSAPRKMPSEQKQSLIAKTWNMYLRGSKARSVRVSYKEIITFD